jgi:hypothetical protein
MWRDICINRCIKTVKTVCQFKIRLKAEACVLSFIHSIPPHSTFCQYMLVEGENLLTETYFTCHKKVTQTNSYTFYCNMRVHLPTQSSSPLSVPLHPFSKLCNLPEKLSDFKCQFYVTRTAKNSKRKQKTF